MKVIYKWELRLTDVQKIEMPIDSQILSIKKQNNNVYLWALVDKNIEIVEDKNIYIYGTGRLINEENRKHNVSFIDTIIMDNGFSWHFFEEKNEL